jgi:hypothetical protein
MSSTENSRELDTISKPTKAHKHIKVHYIHHIPPNDLATQVAIFREVNYKDYIHQNSTEVFGTNAQT